MNTSEPNTWLGAVAERAKLPPEDIEEVLSRLGIRLSPRLAQRHRLIIQRVRFWGRKTIQGVTTDFNFNWPLESGLWCVASESNLVGKSTILFVIIWGLRGEPPSGLQRDVRSWIAGFELVFSLDGERLKVQVDTTDSNAQGYLGKVTGDEVTELQRFSKASDFAVIMNTLMLDRLGLEPIQSRQKRPGTEDGRTVAHGWPAYASALYIGGNHNHLLGDVSMANLPGRLLTMFIGSPWASPLFAAKAALEQLKQEERNHQRRFEDDRKAREESLHPLRARLADVVKRRDALKVADVSQHLQTSLTEVARLTTELSTATQALSTAEAEFETALRFDADARKRLLVIEEAKAAQRFFQGLSPTCCPRCRHNIGEERHKLENTDNLCSVCSEPLQPGDEAAFASELAKAQEAAEGTSAAITLARAKATQAKKAREECDQRLLAAQAALKQASASSTTVLADREAAVIEAARLEATIADRQQFISPLTVQQGNDDLIVLKAVQDELEARAIESEGTLLKALNDQIVELGRRFGITALERVQIDRAAHLKVWKGGAGPENFGDLSPGERLRLRLATVIAILRVAERHGVGRHPGLILIDSPGGEEAKQQNVAALLKELEVLTTELPYLQIIVASAQAPLVQELLEPSRIRIARAGAFVW
jgi:hypothetical protein